jgi:hypothetical protein
MFIPAWLLIFGLLQFFPKNLAFLGYPPKKYRWIRQVPSGNWLKFNVEEDGRTGSATNEWLLPKPAPKPVPKPVVVVVEETKDEKTSRIIATFLRTRP